MKQAVAAIAMKYSLRKRVFLVLGALIVYYLFSYLMDPFGVTWQPETSHSVYSIAGDIVISLALCAFFCEASLYVDKLLNYKLPWTTKPKRRLIVQTVIQIVCSIAFTTIVGVLLYSSPGEDLMHMNKSEITGFIQWLLTTATISLSISALNTGHHMINNWKSSAAEATEHKLRATEMQRVAAEAELQALKLQLDPHFVFNNLSVLSELILENQQLGHEYAENFAKVYRYLLLNAKRDLVSLEEEIKFLKAYLFLIETRSGTGVTFQIEVKKEALSKNVPPLVLQLLIENVLKHNRTDEHSPLVVQIKTAGDSELIVENNIRPLITKMPSSKVGLANVFSRYRLLTNQVVRIISNDDVFSVSIPLL